MTVSNMAPSDTSPRAGERPYGEPCPHTQYPAKRKDSGAALLLLILPVLCCGGPLIFAALAAASAATLNIVGGIISGILLAIALGLFLQHRRHAVRCTPVPAPAPAQKVWCP